MELQGTSWNLRSFLAPCINKKSRNQCFWASFNTAPYKTLTKNQPLDQVNMTSREIQSCPSTRTRVSNTQNYEYNKTSLSIILFTRQKQSQPWKTNSGLQKGKRGGRDKLEVCKIYMLLYIKYITNKDPLYSKGNSFQYSIINYLGKKSEKVWIYVYTSLIHHWITLLYTGN